MNKIKEYRAKPLSKNNIKKIAEVILDKVINPYGESFDVIAFMEFTLPKIFPEFRYEIGDKSEMGDNHGETLLKKRIIRIREDVYEGAIYGLGRDRFTIAHEIGHLLLHTKGDIKLARSGNKVKPYESPEWQANCFASELLMPERLISKDDTIQSIMERFQVTQTAARVRLEKLRIL